MSGKKQSLPAFVSTKDGLFTVSSSGELGSKLKIGILNEQRHEREQGLNPTVKRDRTKTLG